MAEDFLDSRPTSGKPLIMAIGALLIAGLAGGYFWHIHGAAPDKVVAALPQQPPPASSPPEPAIQHPVPPTAPTSAPLPDLSASDLGVGAALTQAVGAAAVAAYLVPENLVRHIVVTVDNLPRQKVALDRRPIVPAPGSFLVTGDELHATLDPQNFRRYTPMVDALRAVDMQRLAAVYLHFYPLFQAAYQSLGYPNGYFNDRLVKVIDDLLATPQLDEPIDLVRPNVMYVFADQTLEARSAGQKTLLRMGPDNAAVVKSKLSELRSIITTTAPAP